MAGPYIRRRVGRDWTWFEDYVYLTATYRVVTSPGRRVQVGMGIFSGGTPLGEKKSIKDAGEFTVLGAGAIHIRLDDDGPECEVAITQDSNVLLPLLP